MAKLKIILAILFSVIMPFLAGKWGLTESSEARYAEISREMYTSGDYLHPSYLGIHHYHKPPVTYYITAAGYGIFGINETGARFFLLISLLLQLWLVYKICGLFYESHFLSLIAVLIYFSFPLVQVAAKNLTTDSYLTTFIFAAIYCFLHYRMQEKAASLYLFYIFCGLAFLTKGPVGLMPQALFAIFYNRYYAPVQAGGFHRYTALLIGLAIAFSWFLLLVLNDPTLVNYFTRHQLVDRISSNAFNRSQPFWYYLAMMPLLGLPVFIYFFDYLRSLLSKRKGSTRTMASVPLRSLIVSFLVFSFSSSKLVLYVMPLYLFISMLSARHLLNMSLEGIKRTEVVVFGFFLALFLLLAVACFADLPLQVPVIPILPLAGAGMIFIIVLYLKRIGPTRIKGPLLCATGMTILTFILPFVMKKNELVINSLKPVAAFIHSKETSVSNNSLIVYNYLLPSLAFYTARKTITLDNGYPAAHREVQFEKDEANWKEQYVRVSRLKDTMLVNSLREKAGFLITRKADDLPDSLNYLRKNLVNRQEIGKWIVYY